MLACRLVALDKDPGTRPVGIGEVYRRLMAKCVLKIVGDRATHACGNLNLCAGLKAGIEGAVHAVRGAYDRAAEDAVAVTGDNDSDAPGDPGTAESLTSVNATGNPTGGVSGISASGLADLASGSVSGDPDGETVGIRNPESLQSQMRLTRIAIRTDRGAPRITLPPQEYTPRELTAHE